MFSLFATACKPTFLGLVPWYQYLKLNGACQVNQFHLLSGSGSSSDLPLVLLAIVDDLLRITGLVAVIFVIYGGVTYATSQGNPDQTSRAQSTIINALVGMAVALIAVTAVSFLGSSLSK